MSLRRFRTKPFFQKGIYYIGVFKRNDERTIYNVLYRDGKNGPLMMKRCAIKGVTRDKEYDITKGTPKSEILYMSVNPNGEAEVLKVYFKPRPRLKKVIVDLDFSTLAIKGRQSQGNLFFAVRHPQDRAQGARRLDARRAERLVRRGRAASQFGRPRQVARRIQGGRQIDRVDV